MQMGFSEQLHVWKLHGLSIKDVEWGMPAQAIGGSENKVKLSSTSLMRLSDQIIQKTYMYVHPESRETQPQFAVEVWH